MLWVFRMFKVFVLVLSIFLFISCDPGDDLQNDDDILEEKPKICSGDIEIDTVEQLEELEDCNIIMGAVFFDNTELTEIVLPDLQEVRGHFIFWENPELTKISFPNLEFIGGHFLVWRNNKLVSFTMESLEEVREDFVVWDNASLETFTADKLKVIGGDFQNYDYEGVNPKLKSFSIANLETIGGSFRVKDFKMKTLSMTKLKSAGSIGLSESSELETLDFPVLVEAGISIRDLSELEFFEFPNLETGSVRVVSNCDKLKTFSLPKLKVKEKDGGGISIRDNDMLERFEIPMSENSSGISVIDNSSLKEFSIPFVENIPNLTIWRNDSLEFFSIPDLAEISRDLQITENHKLGNFDFTSLSMVGCFWISNNRHLPMEIAQELWDQVEERDGIGDPENSSIANNKD